MRSHVLLFSMILVATPFLAPLLARAGLTPTKGSQLVTAFTAGACPIPGHTGQNSQVLTQMVNGDGSTVPLVIPPKKIFVLTDVIATTGAEPAGDVVLVSLIVGSAATGNIVAARFDTVAAGGTIAANFQFPTGVPIKSGSVACVEMLNLTHGGFIGFTAFAHGYLAADK
jgi:hypothetical protein